MEQNLIPQQGQELSTQELSTQGLSTQELSTQELANIQRYEFSQMQFIPSLTVAHPLSEVCKQGIAKPGEFVSQKDNISLGLTVNVVYLTYYWKYQAYTKKQPPKFLESIKLSGDFKPSDSGFVEFTSKYSKDTIKYGMTQLLYLPDQGYYLSFYGKGKLGNGATNILKSNLMKKNVVISLKTRLVETDTLSWYELDVAPSREKTFTDFPYLTEALQLFSKGNSPESDEVSPPPVQR